MLETIRVKDFMNKDVIAVKTDTPVIDVVKILFAHGFNGVPVIDERGTLKGLITDYDFISKGSPIYFSPLGRVLEELDVYRVDQKEIDERIKGVLSSKAKDIMNDDPLTLSSDQTITEAAELFIKHHRVNPVPVIDKDKKLVGVVSRYDLIRLYADPAFWSEFLKARTKPE